MAFLVKPQNGQVAFSVSGHFDINLRVLPYLADQEAELLSDADQYRDRQMITPAMRRFTLRFDNALFEGSEATKQSAFAEDQQQTVPRVLTEFERSLDDDLQVFREGQLSRSGRNVEAYMTWPKEKYDSDSAFWRAAAGAIFIGRRCVPYRVRLEGRVRQAGAFATDGSLLCEVFLTNYTSRDDTVSFGLTQPNLMDVGFSVAITTGTHVPMPRRLIPEDYRLTPFAVVPAQGVNCTIRKIGDRLVTDTAPLVALPLIETPDAKAAGMQDAPTFTRLATDPLPVLHSLLSAAEDYRGVWKDSIAERIEFNRMAEADVMRADAAAYDLEVERMREGVKLLQRDSQLLRAFQLANESMQAALTLQRKNIAQWRLFQLGFILTQLPSIAERYLDSTPETPDWETADVLKFDTGGGKTESYLGHLLIALFYARIKGRAYGVQAWMRFPLRLLSVQQFQRLSYVIAQANLIREREHLQGHPFSLGYFTGAGTPNAISDTFKQETFLPRLTSEQLAAFRFVNDCPYCGQSNSIRVERDITRVRIKHVCTHTDCPSHTILSRTEQGSIAGEIGIFVSDEECYRHLPSILVGTIDKIVISGLQRKFSRFFGTAQHYCPDHGFSERICEHHRFKQNDSGVWGVDKCGNTSRSATPTVPVAPLKDPGIPFALQDEMHLLSESLGNFDSHYESTFSALQIAHGGRPPKILAATATIREYEDHVHHLYMRRARRFPVVGAQTGESFYTRIVRDAAGEPLVRRFYRAFLPIGSRTTAASAALAQHYNASVDALIAQLLEAPQPTAAAIDLPFELVTDAIRYLRRHAQLLLIYTNRKADIAEVFRVTDDHGGTPSFESVRLDAETDLEKVRHVIHQAESQPDDGPLRRIVATNMISHGVDIERLNAMVMVGWPSRMAEYLQASARCGRVHPGLVLCVMSDKSLYELSCYNRFEDYHIFTERLVETVPINRFAPNVLDRTLPGLVGAAILQWAACQPWGEKITAGNCQPLLKALNEDLSRGTRIVDLLANALNPALSPLADRFRDDASREHARDVRARLEHVLRTLRELDGATASQMLSEVLTRILRHRPLTSLRDIEATVLVSPVDEPSRKLLLALGK